LLAIDVTGKANAYTHDFVAACRALGQNVLDSTPNHAYYDLRRVTGMVLGVRPGEDLPLAVYQPGRNLGPPYINANRKRSLRHILLPLWVAEALF
jgi:hypothetical protein